MLTVKKKCNLLMHNFNVAFVDCSYTFRLHECSHHQGVYRMYKREIIVVALVKKQVECVQVTFVVRQDVCCLNVAIKQ